MEKKKETYTSTLSYRLSQLPIPKKEDGGFILLQEHINVTVEGHWVSVNNTHVWLLNVRAWTLHSGIALIGLVWNC